MYKKYVDAVFNVGLAKDVLLAGDGRQDPSRHYAMDGKNALTRSKSSIVGALG
jgi:hypothetical protein